MLTPAVVYLHKDPAYFQALCDFYRLYGLPGCPFFSRDAVPIAALAKEGLPFVVIVCHYPELDAFNALKFAQEVKEKYGDLVVAVYAHTIIHIASLGELDGVISKKPLLDSDPEPFRDVCHIIADVLSGMGKEELFQKYPQRMRR